MDSYSRYSISGDDIHAIVTSRVVVVHGFCTLGSYYFNVE